MLSSLEEIFQGSRLSNGGTASSLNFQIVSCLFLSVIRAKRVDKILSVV